MKLRHILWAAGLLAALILAVVGHSGHQAQEAEPEQAPAFKVRDHGKSWKDLATDAFGKQDWQDAIYWYRMALEADPQDNHGWYNLACVYMYVEQREKAIDALVAAFETGWDDLSHTRSDPDVTAILEEPRVASAIAWVEDKLAKAVGSNTERRFFAQTTTGTYVAYLPPDYADTDRKYPAVMILHGRSSTETNHGNALSEMCGRDGVIYLAVRFPYPSISFIGRSGRAGFEVGPPEDASAQGQEFYPFVQFADALDAAYRDALATYRIDPRRVHVMGHSQGAAAALGFALKHSTRVKSCFAHAGFSPRALLTPSNAKAAADAGVQFILTHSTGDQVVPVSASKEVADELKNSGARVELVTPDSMSHGFPPEVRERVRKWADSVVRVGG